MIPVDLFSLIIGMVLGATIYWLATHVDVWLDDDEKKATSHVNEKQQTFMVIITQKEKMVKTMIENRLRVIAAERYLTARKISEGTGIFEPTLSKIMNNTTTGIKYATINKLCKYLKITPNELFTYTEDK